MTHCWSHKTDAFRAAELTCWPHAVEKRDYPKAFLTAAERAQLRARVEASLTCARPEDRWIAKGYTVAAHPAGECEALPKGAK